MTALIVLSSIAGYIMMIFVSCGLIYRAREPRDLETDAFAAVFASVLWPILGLNHLVYLKISYPIGDRLSRDERKHQRRMIEERRKTEILAEEQRRILMLEGNL